MLKKDVQQLLIIQTQDLGEEIEKNLSQTLTETMTNVVQNLFKKHQEENQKVIEIEFEKLKK